MILLYWFVRNRTPKLVNKASLKRFITAEDVAHAIVFLASPLGASISGLAFPVDGDAQAMV